MVAPDRLLLWKSIIMPRRDFFSVAVAEPEVSIPGSMNRGWIMGPGFIHILHIRARRTWRKNISISGSVLDQSDIRIIAWYLTKEITQYSSIPERKDS